MSLHQDDFAPADLAIIERETREVGHYVFERLSRAQPSVWDRLWWDDRLMQWAMGDESVKVQMFRFVDVLPMLGDSPSVVRHLHEYFDDVSQHLPSAARLGLSAVGPDSIAGRALAIAARRNVMGQARRFIAGTTVDEVLAAAMRQRKLRRAFTIDVLGEAVTSEVEAEQYLDAYLNLIRRAAPIANRWPEIPQIDRGLLSELPRVNVSVKLSALDSRFDPLDRDGTTQRVAARLRTLLRTAREHRAFVNVDMESYSTKDLTLHTFQTILSEEEFRDVGDVGIVLQCYLRDTLDDAARLRDWARQRGKPVWVRLVKGAYWDYETTHARAVGWPVPVFEVKAETDANFERVTRFVLRHHEHLRPAIGSHNVRSIAHAIAVGRHIGLPPAGLELQMLYGMGDQEKEILVGLGHRMRVYMPFGELIPGMAYLVRRLLENTSNDSFLRASFTEHVSPERLLMNPHDLHDETQRAVPPAAPHMTTDSPPEEPFRNEPPADFARADLRDQMQAALSDVRSRFGQFYPLHIGDRTTETTERMASVNPSHRHEEVGSVALAQQEHVEQAVAAARAALPGWSGLGASRRAELIRAASAIMRRRRFELAAWIVHECGKGPREADGDVCEAIDFCEFYARGAVALERPQFVKVPGEDNRLIHVPRGVAAVIAPWNFPLAILTGMTTAALATGNTVVMKPAEQSSVVGAKLAEIFAEVGLPSGVLNYLPGRGEVAGAALVDHPDVALIAFTGSREVGLAIQRRAAELAGSAGRQIKRVIAEMGGKNAIIVDDDADLDEAVVGVVGSAFGYQGQKCSACSRAIVLDAVYDRFLERLVEATRSLQVGPADDFGSQVGPVIDQASFDKIGKYIELGRSEAREALAVDASSLADEGYYVGPHIFADADPHARLAQEEIFGPVLAVIRAADLDEAIRILNDTDYGLTAGIFSRSPAHLQRAQRELFVGNLYLNRGITGALVQRQPFGGVKMSGIGSQAGGPDYLLQYVVPRTITENTMRRGFAPPAETDESPPSGT